MIVLMAFKNFFSRKAQAWGMDLMVAVIIFMIAIVSFFLYTLNNPREGTEAIDELRYDARIISESIMSAGYPSGWELSADPGGTVKTIGVLNSFNENRINDDKLEEFYNLAVSDYDKTKALFNTKFEYFVSLSSGDMDVGGGVSGIGLDPSSNSPKNLVRVTRFTIYKDKPVTLYIDVWED